MPIEKNVSAFRKCKHNVFVSIGCGKDDLSRVFNPGDPPGNIVADFVAFDERIPRQLVDGAKVEGDSTTVTGSIATLILEYNEASRQKKRN